MGNKFLKPFGLRITHAKVPRQTIQTWTFSTELIRDPGGFWQLIDMPTEEELAAYYRSLYWSQFRNRDDRTLVNTRDFEHYGRVSRILKDIDRDLTPSLLNFGSGHGGISLLLEASGWVVINVDPFGTPVLGTLSRHVSQLTEVHDSVDFVYASHSLEHVSDINLTISKLLQILLPGGLFFAEVPYKPSFKDAPSFEEPHTIYFTAEYFASLPLNNLQIEYRRRSSSGINYSVPCDEASAELMQIVGRKPAS